MPAVHRHAKMKRINVQPATARDAAVQSTPLRDALLLVHTRDKMAYRNRRTRPCMLKINQLCHGKVGGGPEWGQQQGSKDEAWPASAHGLAGRAATGACRQSAKANKVMGTHHTIPYTHTALASFIPRSTHYPPLPVSNEEKGLSCSDSVVNAAQCSAVQCDAWACMGPPLPRPPPAHQRAGALHSEPCVRGP